MPTQVNCCNGDSTLSPGENFEFINYANVTCNITNCSPPLVNSSYTVGPCTTAGGSTCPAQVQQNAPPGSYGINVDCCSANHAPTIVIQG